jgi:hypothetical protein
MSMFTGLSRHRLAMLHSSNEYTGAPLSVMVVLSATEQAARTKSQVT